MPGEHDASLDNGKAFKEFFGPTHYTFDHKGVHFIVVDNVSDPMAAIGDEQLQWLKADLDAQPKDARIVVFTHRPLFDLYPQWDWATRDGAQAIALLQTHDNVTVFYGHIHQENHFHDGQHRAPLGEGPDVRVAGRRLAAQAPAGAVGCVARRTAGWDSARSTPKRQARRVRDHRTAGRVRTPPCHYIDECCCVRRSRRAVAAAAGPRRHPGAAQAARDPDPGAEIHLRRPRSSR